MKCSILNWTQQSEHILMLKLWSKIYIRFNITIENIGTDSIISVILWLWFLVTFLYILFYLIGKRIKNKIFQSKRLKDWAPVIMSFIIVLIIAGYVLIPSLVLLLWYPKQSENISIAILSGVISGGFILLVQKMILEQPSSKEGKNNN